MNKMLKKKRKKYSIIETEGIACVKAKVQNSELTTVLSGWVMPWRVVKRSHEKPGQVINSVLTIPLFQSMLHDIK